MLLILMGERKGVGMKLETAFCDVHPGQRLTQADFAIPSRKTFIGEKALRCSRAACSRCYHYDFGYFPFETSEEPDFGNLAAKPSCRIKHDLLYMLLTKINGELVYACFHPDCTSTLPYSLSKKGA